MSLKKQFLVLIGIPLTGMFIIFIVGTYYFTSFQSSLSNLVVIEHDRATMINGDRDAHQAYIAETEAIGTHRIERLKELDKANIENIQQTWERIQGPSQRFPDDMKGDTEAFQKDFQKWKGHSRNVIQYALETAAGNSEIIKSSEAAIIAFNKMRDQIDQIGETIEEKMKKERNFERRKQLETALSLVLNGDRDAYQAYAAQLQAKETSNHEHLLKLNTDNIDNIDQTVTRVTKGARIVGKASADNLESFQSYFINWKQQSRKVFEIALSKMAKENAQQKESKLSGAAFKSMRNVIDQLGEKQEHRTETATNTMVSSISGTLIFYIITVIIILAISIFFSTVLIRSIIKALSTYITMARSIADGELPEALKTDRSDEIGLLAEALNQMVSSLKEKVNFAKQISEGDLDAVLENSSERDRLGVTLEKMKENLTEMIIHIKSSTSSLTDSLSGLSAVSSQMSGATTEMSTQSTTVAGAAEEISAGIETLASSNSEMNANVHSISATATQVSDNMKGISSSMDQLEDSIKKVSDRSGHAQEIAKQAITTAARSTEKMNELDMSANKIGEFSQIIKEIAQQTNLLALNANIEAASAGEAGKGFAVVANEIKELANQSSRSAEDISETISEIQKNTETSVHSMKDVTTIISTIDQSTSEIFDLSKEGSKNVNLIVNNVKESTTGIEEVSSLIKEISSATDSAAKTSEEFTLSSGEISKNMQELNRVVSDTANGVNQVHSQANALSEVSEKLQMMVEKFKLSSSD